MTPKLTIFDASAEVHVPLVVEGPGVYVWRDLQGRPCAYGHSVNGHHWMQWPSLASYRFDDDGSEVVAFPAASGRTDVIIATFQRMVLPLALQRRGLESLHASGVVIGGRVAVFCAVSGVGKSTVAYALSRRNGYAQWSDDAVVFEVGAAGVDALALPFDVRLLPETVGGLAGLPAIRPPVLPAQEGDRAPLGAISVLVRRPADDPNTRPEITRCTGAKALTAVLEHAHCFSLTDAARRRRMLEHYLELVERVPVYEIRFSPGLENLAELTDTIGRTFEA
jgi:hypothetical protein